MEGKHVGSFSAWAGHFLATRMLSYDRYNIISKSILFEEVWEGAAATLTRRASKATHHLVCGFTRVSSLSKPKRVFVCCEFSIIICIHDREDLLPLLANNGY